MLDSIELVTNAQVFHGELDELYLVYLVLMDQVPTEMDKPASQIVHVEDVYSLLSKFGEDGLDANLPTPEDMLS